MEENPLSQEWLTFRREERPHRIFRQMEDTGVNWARELEWVEGNPERGRKIVRRRKNLSPRPPHPTTPSFVVGRFTASTVRPNVRERGWGVTIR